MFQDNGSSEKWENVSFVCWEDKCLARQKDSQKQYKQKWAFKVAIKFGIYHSSILASKETALRNIILYKSVKMAF